MAGKKTGKRLLTWVLVLVMALSLLPLNALAEDIPTEYNPTIKWPGGLIERTVNVTLFYENENTKLGTVSSKGYGTTPTITVPSGIEVYKFETSSGCTYAANIFTFWNIADKSGDLKLYTRSTAGHEVTVNYVFNDESGRTKASVKTQVKYQDEETFPLAENNYSCTFNVTSGDARAVKNTLGRLAVTGGTQDSVITVTYTPEDNFIFIDKYYDNGGIFSKWDGENIKLNGYEFVENNKLAEKSVIADSDLTSDMEDYRFLTVTNNGSVTVYDFSYAVMIPKTLGSTNVKLTDVWYDRDEGHWYYSHLDREGLIDKVIVGNEGGINFCYNTVHSENSAHHLFQLVETVAPTCTEGGYSLYKCAYCAKTEQRDQTAALDHDWGPWKHDDATTGAESAHTRKCTRDASHTEMEPCTFTEDNGTFTCEKCKHSYGTHTAPAYPVYVYAFFAHNGTPLKDNKVTVNGKPIEWNEDAENGEYFVTLGVYRNGTTQEPTDNATLDAPLNVTEYEAATSKGNGTKNGVTLTDITSYSPPSGKVCSGAAGYPESDGKLSWHLDGQVNVYTVTYDNNDGTTQGAPTSNGYYFGSYPIDDAPERDGYTFTGWKDSDGTVYDDDSTINKLSKDLNLVAQWKENTIPTYTFDLSNWNTIKVDKRFVSKYGRSAEKSFTATVTIERKETYTAVVDPGSSILPNVPNNGSAVTGEPTYTKVGEATGTVTLKTDTIKAFDFGKDSNGKDSKFQLEPGDYRITVEETNKGNDRYVKYDTEPYTHTYEFTVDNKGQISIKTPITFTITNEYTKRHTAATPSKPTLNTGDHYAYVMGYPDGTVRPNGSITRAEVSAILFRLLSDKTRDEYFTTESSFTDVKAGAWYNNSIATLEKAGVIVDTAKGGAFRPNEAITRAELAAMLAQFSDAKPVKGVKFSDVSAEHWAYEAIAIAAKMGWIEGYPDGTFRPDATITRAEMMTLVNRALERVPSDEDHLLSKRVMLTFPDCKSGDWFYIAVQEATNSHTYERAATEKNGDEQWTALRANRDWTLLEK